MSNKTIAIAVFTCIVTVLGTGCTKKEADALKAESPSAGENRQKLSDDRSNLTKPDLSTANGAYKPMMHAADSLYAYYAIYPKTVNFGKIVRTLTATYDKETDGFKKQEIITSFKAEMENGIKNAKGSRYYSMNIAANKMDVQPYNFEKKMFFNPGLGINQDPVRSYAVPTFTFPAAYGDVNGAGAAVRFSNVKKFADVIVENQDVARKMEGLRASDKLSMIVYFYANDILPDREDYQELRPEITKVEYLDHSGNVVFTQTM